MGREEKNFCRVLRPCRFRKQNFNGADRGHLIFLLLFKSDQIQLLQIYIHFQKFYFDLIFQMRTNQRQSNPIQESLLENSNPHTKKIIYSCECGKKYLSFPALYVHARIKHTIKLSSSAKSDQWKATETGQCIEKLFYLQHQIENSLNIAQREFQDESIEIKDEEAQGESEQILEKRMMDQMFEEYNKSLIHEMGNQQILKGLYQYLKGKWGQNPGEDVIQLIPYQLNSFAMERLPNIVNERVWSAGWWQKCQSLLGLGKWMHQNKYTKFLTVKNDGI